MLRKCYEILHFKWITKDGKLILIARLVRNFSYGFLSIILAIYLRLVGLDSFLVGIVLTASLLNGIIFTLLASFYVDQIGRRKMLIIYSGLMSLSGAIFLTTNNFIALIGAALIGTINVTGSETGAFLSIEQAVLPNTVDNIKRRNSIFAVYNIVGTFAMAAGVLLAGLPNVFQQLFQLNPTDAIKPLFLLYSILGLTVMGIYFFLSKKIELEESMDKERIPKQYTRSPHSLSTNSKITVAKLSGLFAVDSFAGGFLIQSIVSFWFYIKFQADLILLSYIFSIAGILTAFSFVIASKVADRVGLINTMVFSHIPSNILIIIVAFAPTLPIAIGFYIARMALSQMDVPTRQSYVMSVVREEERTVAAGITNTSRNVAQAISPSIAGHILQSMSLLYAPFLLGGFLKIIYDVALYFSFRNLKPYNEDQDISKR